MKNEQSECLTTMSGLDEPTMDLMGKKAVKGSAGNLCFNCVQDYFSVKQGFKFSFPAWLPEYSHPAPGGQAARCMH